MAEPEVTGMTERAMFCMQPEQFGGCDESENLVPIHYKVIDPDTGETTRNQILGWLCQRHAIALALKNSKRDFTVPLDQLDVDNTRLEE